MAEYVQKLVMMKGLPGCGKSTIALEMVNSDPKLVRINRDLFREMFYGNLRGNSEGYRPDLETLIRDAQTDLARKILKSGYSVIVDDTNLTEDHERRWHTTAKHAKVKFELLDMTGIAVGVCAKRDDERENKLGRLHVYKIAKRAGLLPPTKNKKVELDIPYIVSDIDGTIADNEHRNYVLESGKKNSWQLYFDMMMDDIPREHVVAMLNDSYPDHPLVLVTARPESYRDITEEWLDAYEIKYHSLIMRKVEDARPDWVVKQEIINEYLNKDLIKVWVDDRPQIIRQIQANNIDVIDVGNQVEF